MRLELPAQTTFRDRCVDAITKHDFKWDSEAFGAIYDQQRLSSSAVAYGPVYMCAAVTLVFTQICSEYSSCQHAMFLFLWRCAELPRAFGKSIRASARSKQSGLWLLKDEEITHWLYSLAYASGNGDPILCFAPLLKHIWPLFEFMKALVGTYHTVYDPQPFPALPPQSGLTLEAYGGVLDVDVDIEMIDLTGESDAYEAAQPSANHSTPAGRQPLAETQNCQPASAGSSHAPHQAFMNANKSSRLPTACAGKENAAPRDAPAAAYGPPRIAALPPPALPADAGTFSFTFPPPSSVRASSPAGASSSTSATLAIPAGYPSSVVVAAPAAFASSSAAVVTTANTLSFAAAGPVARPSTSAVAAPAAAIPAVNALPSGATVPAAQSSSSVAAMSPAQIRSPIAAMSATYASLSVPAAPIAANSPTITATATSASGSWAAAATTSGSSSAAVATASSSSPTQSMPAACPTPAATIVAANPPANAVLALPAVDNDPPAPVRAPAKRRDKLPPFPPMSAKEKLKRMLISQGYSELIPWLLPVLPHIWRRIQRLGPPTEADNEFAGLIDRVFRTARQGNLQIDNGLLWHAIYRVFYIAASANNDHEVRQLFSRARRFFSVDAHIALVKYVRNDLGFSGVGSAPLPASASFQYMTKYPKDARAPEATPGLLATRKRKNALSGSDDENAAPVVAVKRVRRADEEMAEARVAGPSRKKHT